MQIAVWVADPSCVTNVSCTVDKLIIFYVVSLMYFLVYLLFMTLKHLMLQPFLLLSHMQFTSVVESSTVLRI